MNNASKPRNGPLKRVVTGLPVACACAAVIGVGWAHASAHHGRTPEAASGDIAAGAVRPVADTGLNSQDLPDLPPIRVNGSGQTYGSDLGVDDFKDVPDLILAEGTNGVQGYVLKTDLYPPAPADPEVAVLTEGQGVAKPVDIPLYDSDGVTVIGQFEIGPGTDTTTQSQ